ncbi:MAG: NADP-dependent oxidoreductase [Candidatus Chisholmbacteria bacterium]|nr:NADP-dependent oxidoreductase [Candidatus Chisholmbacteria bacterium]
MVAEVAGAVEGVKVGDEVYGQAIILGGGSGAWAEKVAAKGKSVALKPKRADFIKAAALALAGVSAVQAVEEHIKLTSGQKILIHGGGGGIGHIALQVAKALGGWVATTVGGEDKEFVKHLGADEVIDYKTERFEEKLRDLDAVFDTVGGEVVVRSFKVLRKGGVLVSMLGEPDKELSTQYGVTGIGQFTRVTTERLKRLAELVDAGKIQVQVAETFPLDEVKAAVELQEQGHTRGKVVLVVGGE